MAMKFPISEIPLQETVFAHLRRHTGYKEACHATTARGDYGNRIVIEMDPDEVEKLRESVLEIVDTYGFSGWRHKGGESPAYGGFSLTYNPDHQDDLPPHVSTIGTPKNASDQFFWTTTGTHKVLKNSYFDSYGFRTRTEASKSGYLGEFLDSFSRSMVRSRVGIYLGENVNPLDPIYQEKAGWHKDEPVFENLRINIPLQTDSSYLFQMEGEEPYHLEVGKAYTWDTHVPHRVFCDGESTTMRIHLVLGFSPWFDYLEGEEAWAPNEHFGSAHPFDMVADGLIGPRIHA